MLWIHLLQVLLCRSQLSTASAYIVIIQNRFFVNNSGNPELIQTTFTQWWGLWWDTFLETLGALSQGRPKWTRKKTFFVRETRTPKCHFVSSWLAWNSDTARESMWQSIFSIRVAKFFREWVTYPLKTNFWSMFHWVSCSQPRKKLIILQLQ